MERLKSIRIAILIGAVILGLVIMAPPCFAAFLQNGTLYYADIATNDIYEKVVMPGDTIALGRTYDLTKVYGVSKTFAWWKDPALAGSSCTPELIIPIGYVQTNGKLNPKQVYIDPAVWKPGSYWQWDGCFERANYKRGHPDLVPYVADDSLAFKVIYDPHPPTPAPAPAPDEIIIKPTVIPTMEEIIIKPSLILTPVPEQKKEDEFPWWGWVIGGIVGIIFVIRLW
jgi:hypothetical protein